VRDLQELTSGGPAEADLEVLTTGLRARELAARCRAAIERDGATVKGSRGQPRPHPLMGAERESGAEYVRCLRLLGLTADTRNGSALRVQENGRLIRHRMPRGVRADIRRARAESEKPQKQE
jgi:hypothetical protein